MLHTPSLVLILSVNTMICWGISNALMKRPSLSIGSARAIRMRQFTMIAIALSAYLLFNETLLPSPVWSLFSFLLGMFGYVPFYFFCQALQIGRVGIVHAIGNSFPLIVALLSTTYLGASLSTLETGGILISMSGVMLLSLAKSGKQKSQPIEAGMHAKACFFSILACVLWGIFFTLAQIPNANIGFLANTLLIQTGCLLAAELHISLEDISKKNISRKVLRAGFFAGILAIAGSFSFYKALIIGNPSVVTAFAGSSPLIASLFSFLLLKETLNKKEILGIGLAVFGVILLSMSKG